MWLAVSLDPAVLEEHVINDAAYQEQVSWDMAGQRVRGERILQLGALVLEQSAWPDPPPESTLAAMLDGSSPGGTRLSSLESPHQTTPASADRRPPFAGGTMAGSQS